MLRTLFVVNKFGGLIFNKDFLPNSSLNDNDYLTIASTFHSLHQISQQLCPLPLKRPSGK